MAFSLGKRLRAVRESLGLTQEQVIEQLEIFYGITLSQQTLSTIEHGKRKVDAERELPAFAECMESRLITSTKPLHYPPQQRELMLLPLT